MRRRVKIKNNKISELKLNIVEINKHIKKKQEELSSYNGELERAIHELQEFCTHDIVNVEACYDYDRNSYVVKCINCEKVVSRGSIFKFKAFCENYKGKLIGNVPNTKNI